MIKDYQPYKIRPVSDEEFLLLELKGQIVKQEDNIPFWLYDVDRKITSETESHIVVSMQGRKYQVIGLFYFNGPDDFDAIRFKGLTYIHSLGKYYHIYENHLQKFNSYKQILQPDPSWVDPWK